MTLPAEEAARADLYAVLARLFHSPPDAAFLSALAAAGAAEDGEIGRAWRELASASAQAKPEAVKEEYDSAFVGTGKAPVSVYATAYTIRYSSEAPLAALRGDLAALGFARRLEVTEPEDHIALLCETMRALIAQERDLHEQKRFFERWLFPAAPGLCAAIGQCDQLRFYKSVAALLLALCTVEHTSFEML